MKKIIILILATAIFIANIHKADSQVKLPYFAGLGLTTISIMGENGNTRSFGRDGGSYNEAQPGIEARLMFNINESKTLRIPVGIDFQFFSAHERFPYFGQYSVYEHSLNVSSLYAGINYSFVKIPVADASLYFSLEPRMSFVSNRDINQTIISENPSVNDSTVTYVVKDNAFRIGGTFKIGVDGRLRDRFYINASFGISALNLFFRDEEGGSLFNSDIQDNGKEEIIGATHVTIMIQYRFN